MLHAVSLDLACQYHVDVGETSLVSLVSRDLLPAVPGVELLVAAADGSLLCLAAGNVTTGELSRVAAWSPSHNYFVFSDSVSQYICHLSVDCIHISTDSGSL